MAAPGNRHATALVLGDRGILIEGPSGSGKTVLALQLLNHGRCAGLFARLVADDQLFLAPAHGRLVARAPAAIAGLAEARGAGPAPVAHLAHAVVDVVVLLVAEAAAPRIYDNATVRRSGIALPCLKLPRRQAATAVPALGAWLGLPPFRNGTAAF